jgi:uncharacterized protein
MIAMTEGKQLEKDIEEAFKNVKKLLEALLADRAVPRNIKRTAQRGIEEIEKEDESHGIRASNVMYMVEELSQDPNIPFHARTTIYRILSLLEPIKD